MFYVSVHVCRVCIVFTCWRVAGVFEIGSTWNGSAERHEGDGRYGILESHRAAECAGHITNNCRQHSDPSDGNAEAEPTSHPIYLVVVVYWPRRAHRVVRGDEQ